VTGPADPRPAAADFPDQVAAQQAWLALLRGEPGPEQGLTGRQWTCLADEATRHHLRGVTYRRLTDGPLAAQVPAEVRERLRSFYLETAGRNAVLFRQTSQLAKALAARDIPVMLLKGIHLSRFVYAEPALRSMADIDIMVHREHLAEAEQVFLDRGFGPLPRPNPIEWSSWNHHLDKLVRDGAPVVELHWHIQRPDAPFRIDVEGLWQRSREAVLDGAPVRLLSPEDLLLHLALHLAYQHRFERAALKGVVDLATVITAEPKMNWEVLAERATAWGASGYLHASLRLAADLLAAPVPPSLFRSLPHRPADEEIVDVARRYILMLRAVVPTVYLELAKSRSLRERATLVLGAVFPPRTKMAAIYGLRAGSPLVYPCYVLRPASLLWNRSVLLFRSFFRTPVMQRTIDRERDRLLLERWHPTPPE